MKVFVTYQDDPKREILEKQLENEVRALIRLDAHPSVIRYYYIRRLPVHVDTATGTLYETEANAQSAGVAEKRLDRAFLHFLVMELVKGGSLGKKYFELAKREPGKICQQMAGAAEGLVVIHRRQRYRDIKPANLLLDEELQLVKVSDLGLAKALEGVIHSGSVTGTVQYLAPEGFSSSEPETHKRDVYAFGVTLYEIFTGKLPIDVDDPPDNPGLWTLRWQEAHRSQPRREIYLECPWMSFELSKIIMNAISPDVARRPQMEEIRDELQKEYFRLSNDPASRQTQLIPRAPAYSVGDKPVFVAPKYMLHPEFRRKHLNQEAYWVEIHTERPGTQTVESLHRALHHSIGPNYLFMETYGYWSFVVCFWHALGQEPTRLWRELEPLIGEGRVMRCSACSVINGKGQEPAVKAKRNLTEREIQLTLHHYLRQTEHDHEAAAKSLVDMGALQPVLVAPKWINCLCFVQCNEDFAKKVDAKTQKNIVFHPLRDKIRDSEGLAGALFFERADTSLEALPENFSPAKWQFLVMYPAKNHRSRYLVTDTILKTSKGWQFRPDSRDATGWYFLWIDSLPFPPESPAVTLPRTPTERHSPAAEAHESALMDKNTTDNSK